MRAPPTHCGGHRDRTYVYHCLHMNAAASPKKRGRPKFTSRIAAAYFSHSDHSVDYLVGGVKVATGIQSGTVAVATHVWVHAPG